MSDECGKRKQCGQQIRSSDDTGNLVKEESAKN
jgi:hypothetical protein